jgi:hypothetical protein
MRDVIVVLCLAGLLTGSSGSAQTASPQTPEQRAAAYDAHKGDFDYLLGDWQFTGNNREFGRFRGYWSALRLGEGQILDEYRVVDDGGETLYVTTTIRNYNAFADRWELMGMDRGNGLQDAGTAWRDGGQVTIEQRFGVAAGGTPTMLRIRYHDILPDRFSWTADRSIDGGETWESPYQTIQARRIGDARSLGPLVPARR